MDEDDWQSVAARQSGLLARSGLENLGVTRATLRAQLAARRWRRVTPTVIATFTGDLNREQLMWCGVLHAGPRSMIAGLTTAELSGLKRWDRDEITVLLPDGDRTPSPVEGILFRATARSMRGFLRSPWGLPRAHVEPAALLWASTQPSERSATGVLHALVQQRLAEPETLAGWMAGLGRLRHGPAMREAIVAMDSGVQSVAEMDLRRMCRRFGITEPTRQVRRRDSTGKTRFSDAEWRLRDHRTIVLEVDGGFHMDAESWEEDIARQRALAQQGIVSIRCTARELRDEPTRVAGDLTRLGVPRLSDVKRSS